MSKMNWIFALAILVALGWSQAAQAQEGEAAEAAAVDTSAAADEAWLNTVWTQVEEVQEREELKLQETVTVAGVRGAKEGEDAILDKLYFKGGKRYPTQDKLKKAVETLKKSVAKEPEADDVPQKLFFIGQCYEKLSQNGDATEFYNQLSKDHPESVYAERAQERLDALAE